MPGFGNSPFGQFPFGVGSSATPDPLLGETTEARFIDPITKDFVSDPITNRLQDMPVLDQRVLLAITTTLQSSSAMPGLGIDFSTLKKIDAQFVSRVQSKIKLALLQMTDVEKVISISSILVKVGAVGRVHIKVSYIDLSTQLPSTVNTTL